MQKAKKFFCYKCFYKIKLKSEFNSSSVPKVLFDNKHNLLYMTRAPAPANKKFQFTKAFKQVCIYAYPRNVLKKIKKNKKGKLEKIEDIEILRFLENGQKVKLINVEGSEVAIDTKKDVFKAKQILKKNVKTTLHN